MSAVAIIPARGGSTRIPGKNIKAFHGRPIITYSIETAIKSGLFDAGVWVSTEDPEIARIARAAGAKLHHRQKALAANHVGTQEVMRAALKELYLSGGIRRRSEFACCLYATAPMLKVEDLRDGYNLLVDLQLTGRNYVWCEGIFYWGTTAAFLADKPLDLDAAIVKLGEGRGLDINTPADWARAEQLYAAMHKEEKSNGP